MDLCLVNNNGEIGKMLGLKDVKLHRRQQRRICVQVAIIVSTILVLCHYLSGLGHLSPSLQEKNPPTGDWKSNSALAQSLSHVLCLMPNENQVKELLSPIDVTGEQRMKEFGIRTRQYKQLYDAWETLHQGHTTSNQFVPDNLIQHFYQNPSIATTLGQDITKIVHIYDTYRSIITQLSLLLFPWITPYFGDHFQLRRQLHTAGRGLVFTAGNDQTSYLLTSIPTIRKLGCTLPIEVMYLGENDLSSTSRTSLEALSGVTTRDLQKMINNAGWTLRGWAAKPFAVLFSSFREIIFIDADSFFLQNPMVLFDDFAYRETGALFFKDRLMSPESKREWMRKVLPEPVSKKAQETRLWSGQSGHMQESGVLVIDTYRHFFPLLIVTRMNGPDRDGDKKEGIRGVYDMVYGDKETFWLGWELAGSTDYAFHNGSVGTIGVVHTKSSGQVPSVNPDKTTPLQEYTICAPQLLHLDRMGRPLWFNGWLLENKFAKAGQKRPAKFEAYVQEEEEEGSPRWELKESNIACLTAKTFFSPSQEEEEVFDMIIEAGKRYGAF